MTKSGFERFDRYPVGHVWLKPADVICMSHSEAHQRVLILRTGERVLVRDTMANVTAVLGELPPEEGKSDG